MLQNPGVNGETRKIEKKWCVLLGESVEAKTRLVLWHRARKDTWFYSLSYSVSISMLGFEDSMMNK